MKARSERAQKPSRTPYGVDKLCRQAHQRLSLIQPWLRAWRYPRFFGHGALPSANSESSAKQGFLLRPRRLRNANIKGEEDVRLLGGMAFLSAATSCSASSQVGTHGFAVKPTAYHNPQHNRNLYLDLGTAEDACCPPHLRCCQAEQRHSFYAPHHLPFAQGMWLPPPPPPVLIRLSNPPPAVPVTKLPSSTHAPTLLKYTCHGERYSGAANESRPTGYIPCLAERHRFGSRG